MSVIEHLDARVGLLYGDFDRGLAAASKGLDEFEALAKSKLAGIEVPAPRLGRAGLGEARDELQSTADSAASSFAPLAGTIRLALGQAVAPLAQFAARFSAQFD